jgi:hypothetical protein
MDALYLVRAGVAEDLRYSLRSLAANVPHDRVWIVGSKPKWCQGVEHLPSRAKGSKWSNLPADLLWACKQEALSERFSYWNDDFFCLAPVDEIPLYHRGPLSDYIGRKGQACSSYIMGQRQTFQLLRRWGYPEPLSYETHMPLVFEKAILRATLERARTEGPFKALAYRSLYGAVAGLGGTKVEDMKKTSRTSGIAPGMGWISTSDGSFEAGKVGREIRAMFREPSPYERSVS